MTSLLRSTKDVLSDASTWALETYPTQDHCIQYAASRGYREGYGTCICRYSSDIARGNPIAWSLWGLGCFLLGILL